MKVSIQTLANKKYVLEVDEKDTVLTLKNRIHSELSLGEVDEQKLIHLGKILKNEQELEASGVKNNSSIVLMLSKIKKAAPAAAPAAEAPAGPSAVPAAQPAAVATPTPAAAPATPAAAPAPAAEAPATPAAAPATPAAAAATPAAPATPVAPTAAQAESALAMGAGLEAMVEQLMSLGFPRDQVQLALRAAYNNADRAAEYLFDPAQLHAAMRQQGQGRAPAPQSGVAAPAGGQSPAGVQPPVGGAPASDAQANALAQLMANAQQGAAGAEAGAVAGGDAGGAVDAANPLAGLAASPQFQQMRAILQQQPQLIPVLLQQLAQREPALAQLIAQNPEALAELLAGGGGGAGGAAPSGPRTHTIQITMEEKQQLDNLEALGFSRQRALEAWLLSDRNEMLAANYLFDHAGDDMEDDAAGQQGGGGAQ